MGDATLADLVDPRSPAVTEPLPAPPDARAATERLESQAVH
jgi:hypothetical protein